MKSIILVLATLLIFILTQIINLPSRETKSSSSEQYTIVIHAGAGTISKDLPDSVKEDYFTSLETALRLGRDLLEQGTASIDVVEKVVNYLEDDPRFNAGKGAVYTSAGTHELDASIMDGKNLAAGAVSAVKLIKNPVSLARLVMENTPHILLTAEGAEAFGKKMNVKFEDAEYFNTEKRYLQWQKELEKSKQGTVGCVALDKHGNLAAATSTGGLTNKLPGRVGDTPIIGAGNYANNNTCAVSGTGKGEQFIRHMAAFNISALMEYKNYSLEQAANEVVHELFNPGDGGVIAVDKNGSSAMVFNTPGMFRGVANSEGLFEVKIWE
jgi:beta-aspartyl-peptidase (threonine type)